MQRARVYTRISSRGRNATYRRYQEEEADGRQTNGDSPEDGARQTDGAAVGCHVPLAGNHRCYYGERRRRPEGTVEREIGHWVTT